MENSVRNSKYIEFFEGCSEILIIPMNELKESTNYREESEEWDSLRGFAMLILIEDVFGVQMSEEDFIGCVTLADIIKAVGA